jgi:protein-glucosylgalactosylhydroxylysine glucosidase
MKSPLRLSLTGLFAFWIFMAAGEPIDRLSLVTRHNVILNRFDPSNPLSIGNGGFCFTVDATGLQTFPESFEKTTPLGTLSDWGWHTFPNPNHWSMDTFSFTEFPDLNGRLVPYADVPKNKMTPEMKWLRENPHRLDLGQIGFLLRHRDGSPATATDLANVRQELDLWNGRITSHFTFDGEPVDVQTVCPPALDAIAVRVTSPLITQGRLGIQIHFPYGTGDEKTADWEHPEAHETTLIPEDSNHAEFFRKLDDDTYYAKAMWSEGATLRTLSKHQFEVVPPNGAHQMDFVCAFSPAKMDAIKLPGFAETESAARDHWNSFWRTGGAIDLSGSKDSRWFELERRIVLSQYLTAIQDAGQFPPAETGLTYNSWEGKFHLEMYFWHEAHFALWDRLPLLEKSLGWYHRILPQAENTARKQGYEGARWPKMTCPAGIESPSPVGPFLIWQEPHPIFFAELCYRSHPDHATLERYRDIVFQTADFMASYAGWDSNRQRFVLDPTLQCAQEIFPKNRTLDPTFELTYWRWGLQTAQQWREQLGMSRERKWDDVLDKLAPLPVAAGKYLFTETTPDSYTNPKWNADHPAVLDALSFVPGPGVDPTIMSNTFDWVWNNWNWRGTWGWDYPAMAMTAARLGEPERSVDALLLDTPKNHCGINGQEYQRPGLSIYLPANGGLLYAVALMAAGWDGAPNRHAPGFPDNGQWNVKWEDLKVAP